MNPIDRLYPYLQELQPLALAMSGGLDSTTLALILKKSGIRFTGFTMIGPHLTDYEIESVISIASLHDIEHDLFFYDYRHISEVVRNDTLRCFHCKMKMFKYAQDYYTDKFNVIDGTNYDDLNLYRPGIKANQINGIISPFADLSVTKENIRECARRYNLNFSANSSRSCILCRFEYQLPLDYLEVIKIRSVENYLLRNHFRGFRFRKITAEKYLFQLDISEHDRFTDISDDFYKYAEVVGVTPFNLEVLSFNKISGYYDRQ